MDAAQPSRIGPLRVTMNLLQIHEPGETPLPHVEQGIAVGIDLGTTHSVVAVAHQGKADILRDSCGGGLIPSVVHYAGSGQVTVGKLARARFQEGDALAVASIKRLMGKSGEEAAKIAPSQRVVPGNAGMAKLEIGSLVLSPVEVSADILRHVKTLAEAALEKEVTQAVITVPAYFDEAARQATKDAAKLAGLEVLRLINEPTAAALAYGLDSGAEGVYAVYDLGGGTFDISILRMEKGVFQVLSTAGHTTLGGDDIDHAIARHWKAKALGGEVLSEARNAKEQLSEAEQVSTPFGSLTRKELDAIVAPFIEQTLSICTQALADAKLSAKNIAGVVLVGGSTRLLALRKAVGKFFEQEPLTDINPDEVVAVGAAIQADGLTRGSDNLLLDVVPLSLGLETMGGLMEKLIHRNTPIPVAVEQEFTTYQDGQNGMSIHVLQGEREMVEQNRSLARFNLTGIPPLPAGIARIKVRLVVDADGLLTVSAREEHTGEEQTVAVKPSYGLAEDEMERMLLDSMKHAKTDIMERLLREAVMEAGRSIEELKSAIASDGDLLLAPEKQQLESLMKVLTQQMGGSERDLIDLAREQLMTAAQPFAERRMDRAIASALKGAHVDSVANG